jgi:hypothetical protein
VLLLPRLIGLMRKSAVPPGIRRDNGIYVLVLVKGLWAGEGLAKSIKNTIVEQHPRWKEALLFVFMSSLFGAAEMDMGISPLSFTVSRILGDMAQQRQGRISQLL